MFYLSLYIFLSLRPGFHSPCISSALPALQEWLNEHRHFFTQLSIPLYSTVYGKEIPGDQQLTPEYWVRTRLFVVSIDILIAHVTFRLNMQETQ